MTLPFSVAEFLDVFRRYNEAVWPAQPVLLASGIAAVVLAARARPASDRATAGILGMLWLWTGAVYHLAFFRTLTPAALLFGALWLAQGAQLLWRGAWRGALAFRPRPDTSGAVGALLALYALVAYPAVGYVLGHRYPTAPTFGAPCPTTILTFAVLAWSARPVPWPVLAVPIAWGAAGTSAALQLGMREDLGLTVAAVVGAFAALRAGTWPRDHAHAGPIEAAWAAVQMAVQLALGPVLHRWRTHWGASDAEARRPLPGDDLVPRPTWSYTHAITIDAPRSAVWPWLLQLGQGRGGFYSYEALENLVGCDIHNVPELRASLQDLHEGDVVRLHRSGYGPAVIELDDARALVLGGDADADGSCATWSFHLVELPDGRTRLIERGRHFAGRGLLAKLGFGPYLVDPVGFVMSRKMLRTIKRLAEAHAHARPAPAVHPSPVGGRP